jgi:hypothetical protein
LSGVAYGSLIHAAPVIVANMVVAAVALWTTERAAGSSAQ